jgi:CRP/FNR family transcriptional regulator, anaerobic regulatory protein
MAMKCRDCVLRRERCFRPQSDSELDFATAMHRGEITLGSRRPLVKPGQPGGESYTLLEGWMARYRIMPNGTRYVLDVLLPGDFFGTRPSLTSRAVDLVASLTPARLCVLDKNFLPQLVHQQPDLCFKFLRLKANQRDRIEARWAMFATGSAAQRLAYFCLEIFDRLKARRMADTSMCSFPFSRTDLSEILGLSEVHVSRVAAELRRDGLIHLANNILVILDRPGLIETAGMLPPSPSFDAADA